MKIKLMTTLGLVAVFAMTGIASATLLTNGDFSLDDGVDPMNAADWTEFSSGGWVNRETAANGTYGDTNNFHYAIGNAGGYGADVSQEVTVADDGSWYGLTADSSLDDWWLNSGYVKLEFYDAGANLLQEKQTDWTQPDYDVGTPWANYAVYSQAPAGAVTVKAVLGSWGEGGTARFDNAVLDVVPEPATFGLLGLAGAALMFIRRFRI